MVKYIYFWYHNYFTLIKRVKNKNSISSSDGSLKIWDEKKVLISEVMLDSTLTSGCFLNGRGDVVIGFKNHIFKIDHSKCKLTCSHFGNVFLYADVFESQ